MVRSLRRKHMGTSLPEHADPWLGKTRGDYPDEIGFLDNIRGRRARDLTDHPKKWRQYPFLLWWVTTKCIKPPQGIHRKLPVGARRGSHAVDH